MFRMRGPIGVGCAVVALAATALACDELPKDPEGTLERVRGGTLVVGVTDSPPWVRRTGDAAHGPEADLVRAFGERLDARVQWRWGPVEDHLAALERFELDLVAAGITERTPWNGRVGVSRPWHEPDGRRGVLAVAPGENGFLTELDRHILARSGSR